MDINKYITITVHRFLNESDSPNMKVLDYIFDIVNEFGEYKLTPNEKEYYLLLKGGHGIDKKLEDFILGTINKTTFSIHNLIRTFEKECGNDFKEFNFDSDSLALKTKGFLVISLRQFFGIGEIEGAYSNLNFNPDMTISDIIIKLYNTKESVWYKNKEFLKILKDFLFKYLDDYLGVLAINGFNLEKIK
jgi:hypothetical protein